MNENRVSAGENRLPCESAPENEKHTENLTLQAAEKPREAAGYYAAEGKTAESAAKIPLREVLFALCFLAAGYLFWEWQFWSAARFQMPYGGTAAFTVLFAVLGLSYLAAFGIRPRGESFFWLAVLLLLGLAYLVPQGEKVPDPAGRFDLDAMQYVLLLGTAGYWAASAAGRLGAKEKTSDFLAGDLLNTLLLYPFGNFGRLPAVLVCGAAQGLRVLRQRKRKKGRGRRIAAVLTGIVLAVCALCAAVPLLIQADAAFEALWKAGTGRFGAWLSSVFSVQTAFYWLEEFIPRTIFALPTAFYLYGLWYACVHGRKAQVLTPETARPALARLRILPRVSISIALGALCCVYLLFIALQARYLFGAFAGVLPQGFTYAGYARRGFFELCRIAALNLVILILAGAGSRTPFAGNKMLRAGCASVSVLTLLLIVTALSKMGLYISVYGLTQKRVLATVFLVWMAAVYTMILVLQLKNIRITRAAVLSGAVLFVLLCVLPFEGWIARCNQLTGHEIRPVAPEAAEEYRPAEE